MIMHPRITIIEITQQNTFLVINARTGILKPSLRTITSRYVRFQRNIHSSSVGMVDSSFSSRDVLGCC